VLEDEPFKVPKQCHHLASRRHTFEFLVCGQ
jgi:hypothetical protein